MHKQIAEGILQYAPPTCFHECKKLPLDATSILKTSPLHLENFERREQIWEHVTRRLRKPSFLSASFL